MLLKRLDASIISTLLTEFNRAVLYEHVSLKLHLSVFLYKLLQTCLFAKEAASNEKPTENSPIPLISMEHLRLFQLIVLVFCFGSLL